VHRVTSVFIGLLAVLSIWAMVSFRYNRMLLTLASALFPVLVAGLATQLTDASDEWYALGGTTVAGFAVGILVAFGLRWINHHPPTAAAASATAETPAGLDGHFAKALAVAYGVLGALALFSWAAWQLQGQPHGLRWHAIFAVGAMACLMAAVILRRRLAAYALGAFALVILGLSGWGALIFPDLVRARATDWVAKSEGAAFCFVAPQIEARPPDYAGIHRAYDFASWPQEPQDLTLLTIAKPLGLVVERDNPFRHADFDLDETVVWEIGQWSLFRLDFAELQTEYIATDQPANFVDCHPRRDYFAQTTDRDLREAVVLSRPLLDATGSSKDWKWGPLLRDAFVIPAALQPRYRWRFFDEVRLDVLAPLLPGTDPLWVSLHYWHHPEYEVGHDVPSRLKGVADPEELSAWHLTELGLYELYSEKEPADGSFAAYRADGRIRTYIWCDYGNCTHSFVPETPLWQSDVYIQTGYPVELLAQWDKIEAAALAQFLALRADN
jgi:hypothetical protein